MEDLLTLKIDLSLSAENYKDFHQVYKLLFVAKNFPSLSRNCLSLALECVKRQTLCVFQYKKIHELLCCTGEPLPIDTRWVTNTESYVNSELINLKNSLNLSVKHLDTVKQQELHHKLGIFYYSTGGFHKKKFQQYIVNVFT
jgi:hypothetical protein